MLALDILGPVALRRDGAAQRLTVKKTLALLVLLCRSGPLPRSRVVAMLWPQLDESSGRRNLRRELARLREAGVEGAVQADGDFLALSTEVASDVGAFDAALAGGRPDDALAHWRGAPADGLALDDAEVFDDWLALERERLLALRRRALEASATAHESQGNHELALERVQSLLADDPLQEQHHRDAMRLHMVCGRREAALAQFERCRQLLDSELGLQPMADTEDLVAVLRGPAAGQPVPPRAGVAAVSRRIVPVPVALLPELLPFVGRRSELAWLEAAWPSGHALLIEGEAGAGKSRLATDFAATQGPYALVRCRSGDAGVPYASFTRALRVLAGPALDIGDSKPWVRSELARLLPELGVAPPPLRGDAERSRFIEACTLAWLALAADSFDAVILDDWHQADAASRELLAYVAQRRHEQGGHGARELLLYRPELDAEAARAVQRLRDDAGARHLRLGPLTADAVLALLQQLSGAERPERFAARLGQATAGNPFFLAETLRHLAEQQLLSVGPDGLWSTPFDDATQDYRELPVPQSVHAAVLARVQRLGSAAQRVLEAAALAAEPFDPSLLAPACALSELDAVMAIEQAVQARLLREHDAGGYGFAHDLVQQALEASLGDDRRRLVHRRLALGAEGLGLAPSLIAQHHEASGQAARALPFRLAAGDEALRLFDNALALQHWRSALSAAPDTATRARLLSMCARAQIELGDAEGASASIAAHDLLLDNGALAVEARAEATIASAEHHCQLDQSLEALARIDALLAQPMGGHRRMQALRVRSQALQNLGRLDEARTGAEAALQLADGDAMTRAGLLDMLLMIEYLSGRPQQAMQLARQSVALWTVHGDGRHIVRGHFRIGTLLLVVGDTGAGKAELERARAMAAELHLVEQQRDVIVNLMKVYADCGDGAGMLALAEEAWRLSPGFPRPRTRQLLMQARMHAHTLLGQLGTALSIAEQVLAEAEANGEPAALQYAVLTVLDLLVYLGDFARGRALLERLANAGTQELAFLGTKLALLRAFLEVHAGDAAAARAALTMVGDPQALQQPQDRLDLALREAELLLAESQPAVALQRLDQAHDGAPHVQLQATMWALRLRAAHELGQMPVGDWQQARTLYDTGRVPPLEVMGLQHALALTAPSIEVAAALIAARAALVARLAESLAEHPTQRAAFVHRWG